MNNKKEIDKMSEERLLETKKLFLWLIESGKLKQNSNDELRELVSYIESKLKDNNVSIDTSILSVDIEKNKNTGHLIADGRKHIDVYKTVFNDDNIYHMFEDLTLAIIASKKYEKYIDYQSELNSLYQIIKKWVFTYYNNQNLAMIKKEELEQFDSILKKIKVELSKIDASKINKIELWYSELDKLWKLSHSDNHGLEIDNKEYIDIYEIIPNEENISYMFKRLLLPTLISTGYELYKDYWNDYNKILEYVENWIGIYYNTNNLTNIPKDELDDFDIILSELFYYCMGIDSRYIEEIDIWHNELLDLIKASISKE